MNGLSFQSHFIKQGACIDAGRLLGRVGFGSNTVDIEGIDLGVKPDLYPWTDCSNCHETPIESLALCRAMGIASCSLIQLDVSPLFIFNHLSFEYGSFNVDLTGECV